MMANAEWQPEGPTPTASFYLPADDLRRKPQLVAGAVELVDAVTVAGPSGPEVMRGLRDSGLELSFLCDGLGYAGKDLPNPESWVSLQRSVGAGCPMLPGVYLAWDKDEDRDFLIAVQEQGRIAADLGAMILVAIDVRWIARKTELVVDAFESTGQSVALVLAHPGDPLSINRAVQGLRRVVQRVGSVYLLRSDHGAIGALAFGARHAAVGLRASTRHYAPPTRQTWRRPVHSARLFVRPLIDWYLASDVAGWTAAGQAIICPLPCCGGSSLARFLDTDEDADWHNMNALSDLADYVIRAPAADRATVFLEQCRSATAWYGLAGFKGPERPKAQLTGWVLS